MKLINKYSNEISNKILTIPKFIFSPTLVSLSTFVDRPFREIQIVYAHNQFFFNLYPLFSRSHASPIPSSLSLCLSTRFVAVIGS